MTLNITDRRQFLKRGAAVASAGPLAAFLAACGGTTSSPTVAAVGTRTLTVRIPTDIQNLDPALEPSDADLQTIFNIYENLVSFRPGTFDTVNTLAEAWEPAKDGLSVRFKLKPGIPFHGGFGDVTADDVRFSFERIAGLTRPKVDSPYKGLWAALSRVRVTGEREGVIELSARYAPLMTLTVPGNVGQIVSRKAIEQRGKGYATHPIGTGPYEFVSWTPQQEVVLKRFEGYGGANKAYASAAQWEEIRLKVVTDDSAASIALESGDVDFGQIPLSAIDRFQRDAKFDVSQRTTEGYKWLGMNVLDPKLEDIRVRQAIRAAVDVPGILTAAFDGHWKRATAAVPPNMPLGHWAAAPTRRRDVAQAKALLTAAGASGLHLTLTYDHDEPGGSMAAQVIQANLKDIGITVDVRVEDHATFLALGAGPQAKRELFYVGFNSQPDPAQTMQWFTTAERNQYNFMNWFDERYSALAAAAVKELDPAKRAAMYVEMQQRWDDNVNAVWIAWPSVVFAAKKGVAPTLRPDGRFVAWAFRSH
jgi:peptide/nickel transport system substrate-binding protein